jgi:hypothetical protein
MAFHNANWTAVPMTTGTYTLNDLGNGKTGSTVHQVFCTGAGDITISAMGGGEFTWSATAGQKVDVVAANIVVASGTFVAFKSAFQPNWNQQARIQ